MSLFVKRLRVQGKEKNMERVLMLLVIKKLILSLLLLSGLML